MLLGWSSLGSLDLAFGPLSQGTLGIRATTAALDKEGAVVLQYLRSHSEAKRLKTTVQAAISDPKRPGSDISDPQTCFSLSRFVL